MKQSFCSTDFSINLAPVAIVSHRMWSKCRKLERLFCLLETCFRWTYCVVQGWTSRCTSITVHWVYTSVDYITAVLRSDTWRRHQVSALLCLNDYIAHLSKLNVTC